MQDWDGLEGGYLRQWRNNDVRDMESIKDLIIIRGQLAKPSMFFPYMVGQGLVMNPNLTPLANNYFLASINSQLQVMEFRGHNKAL